MKFKVFYIGLILLLSTSLKAQETKWAYQTFRDTRVVNGHSVEMNTAGEGKFIISHRFGSINGGLYNLFGLDAGVIRYGFDFGWNEKTSFGIGRSSIGKTIDGYFKKKLFYQKSGADNFPFSMVYLSTMTVNGLKWSDTLRNNFFSSRLSYSHHLILARKFNDRFSLQLMPTLVHRNLVYSNTEANSVYSLGVAARYQITKVLATQVEYYYVPDGQLAAQYKNSFSVGVEFQTKGHVFQFHLSNATGMVEPMFITETVNAWHGLGVGLGFNISRDFKFRYRKYH